MSNISRRPSDVSVNLSWVLVWLALIVTGASTTSLLRVPVSNPEVAPAVAAIHRYGAGAAAAIAAIVLLRGSRPSQIAGSLAVVTAISGVFAARSFAPSTVTLHAWLAGLTAAALAVASSPGLVSPKTPPRWLRTTARTGLVFMVVQAALGASLRHHLLSLGPHLLVAGLASLTVLVPAVATLQAPSADVSQHAAARFAVAATLVQLSLGILILLMIALGDPPPWLWISTTVAHVATGAVTLLGTVRFVRALR